MHYELFPTFDADDSFITGRTARRRRSAHPCKISPWSLYGVGLRPQKFENLEFYRYNCPLSGESFARFLGNSLGLYRLQIHNSATFSWFISVNDKTINNLLRWRHFQPNFRWPLTAKLLIGSKNVSWVIWWHGPPLSSCKVWWKSNYACRRERTKCDFFYFVSSFVCHGQPFNGAGEYCIGRFRRGLQSVLSGKKSLLAANRQRVSPSFGQYQIILLVDRGICVKQLGQGRYES